jgi:hypothetical protein
MLNRLLDARANSGQCLCSNPSGRMLGRLSGRQREFAMRAAFGAARFRLIRQTLLESCVIGACAITTRLPALTRPYASQAFARSKLNSREQNPSS